MLYSRDDPAREWRARGSGVIKSLAQGGDREPGAVVISPGQDRRWQVAAIRGAESLGRQRLRLELGYTPPRLRFLGQGEPPFLIAYGSRRAGPATLMDCAELGDSDSAASIGLAVAGRVQPLGAEALTAPAPPKPPPPVRRYVLWAVLGTGILLVLAMAMQLLRKLRVENP